MCCSLRRHTPKQQVHDCENSTKSADRRIAIWQDCHLARLSPTSFSIGAETAPQHHPDKNCRWFFFFRCFSVGRHKKPSISTATAPFELQLPLPPASDASISESIIASCWSIFSKVPRNSSKENSSTCTLPSSRNLT